MGRELTPDMLRDYVARANDDELEEFLAEIAETIEMLEQDDFFGTEGFEKRYG